MLLHRNALAIRHQLRYIAAQDSVIARGTALKSIEPTTQHQVDVINRQLRQINAVILRYNMLLQPAKLKLIMFMTQTAAAIDKLGKLAPSGSSYNQCYQDSLNTFKDQIEQAQEIINRPPATPFLPSSLSPGFAAAPAVAGGVRPHRIIRTIDVHPTRVRHRR